METAESELAPGPRCVHLRAKTMYISGLAADAPEPPFHWCNRTLRELGPDGESVNAGPCSEPGRACYQNGAGGAAAS